MKANRARAAKAARSATAPSPAKSFNETKRIHYETIGSREYALEEQYLHVNEDVVLWELNPRILRFADDEQNLSEDNIAGKLRRTSDYDALKKSIEHNGQITPVFAWKGHGRQKYVIIEGNTRVTALRDLSVKYEGDPERADFLYVRAKVLPPEFTHEEIVLLLVGIHVRGSGVRDWDRYVQARTVYDAVTPVGGKKPLTTITKLAAHMGKSVSWVSRLVAAYAFSKAYEDHHDSKEARAEAIKYFSVLEEIARASGFGPKVRDLDNPAHDSLRADVFGMVQAGVFTEYRDARHIQQFHEDAEKWAMLKTHEPGIGHRLAAEAQAGTGSSIAGRIAGLPDAIKRTLIAKPDALSEEHLEQLHESVETLSAHLANANAFRLQLSAFGKSLKKVSFEDLEEVSPMEIDDLVKRLNKARSMIAADN